MVISYSYKIPIYYDKQNVNFIPRYTFWYESCKIYKLMSTISFPKTAKIS